MDPLVMYASSPIPLTRAELTRPGGRFLPISKACADLIDTITVFALNGSTPVWSHLQEVRILLVTGSPAETATPSTDSICEGVSSVQASVGVIAWPRWGASVAQRREITTSL